MTPREEATAVVWLGDQMRAGLAGKPSQVQSAVLADLLATFLAGHIMVGDEEATNAVREEHLGLHIELVRKLIPVNFRLYIEPKLKEKGLI
jgi:hypothetical protein